MKRITVIAFMILAALSAWGQEAPAEAEAPNVDPTPTQAFVFGPRVGFGWSMVTSEAFTAGVQEALPFASSDDVYYPYYSIFGFNAEYRVLLGQSRDHFAIQGLAFLFGIEQSLFLPAGALLLGYRNHSGFEFGVGPIFNIAGIGVIAAVGFTFSVGGVNIPIDVSYQIPNNNISGALAITTGFNFTVDRSTLRAATSRR